MLPIHDHTLNGYEVDAVAQTIVLHTVYPHSDPPLRTDVRFRDVRDHYFPFPRLPSILFEIEPAGSESVIREHRSQINEGHRLIGWPSFYAGTVEAMVRGIEQTGHQFYVIESSFGLDGWVLAKDVQSF